MFKRQDKKVSDTKLSLKYGVVKATISKGKNIALKLSRFVILRVKKLLKNGKKRQSLHMKTWNRPYSYDSHKKDRKECKFLVLL